MNKTNKKPCTLKWRWLQFAPTYISLEIKRLQLLWSMVTHLFLTGWMLHIPSSLRYLLCSVCHEKEESYFNLLQIRWVMKTSVTHVCYFCGSSLILIPCNCSWLGCFCCCSFQGPWGLNQGTTFLVQGFLSWAFSWCHNLGSDTADIFKKAFAFCHTTGFFKSCDIQDCGRQPRFMSSKVLSALSNWL